MAQNKNPFQVRLETLKLAKDILSENAEARRNHHREIRDFVDNGGTLTETDTEHEKLKTVPDGETVLFFDRFEDYTYSGKDVLKEAEKLYEFICKTHKGDGANF